MKCRQCGTELEPYMVTDLDTDKEYHWKLNGELVYYCPKGCWLNQCETASKQRRMKEKPTPRFVRR